MAVQRAGLLRALKYHLVREFLGDVTNTPQARLVRSMMKKRPALWKKGSVRDIKKGDYFTFCGFVPAQYQDPEHFDKIQLFRNSQDGLVWAKGLERNVYLRTAGKHVLVMDNHNFAAAFIIEMFRRGIIKAQSSMVHVDEHPDCFGFTGSFRYKEYIALTTDAEKMRYLMQKAGIEDWQIPLLQATIVDANKWKWLALKKDGSSWCNRDQLVTFISFNLNSIRALAQRNRWDIVDVDMDVLLPLDKALSGAEKSGVLAGRIPSGIKAKLNDIAWLAGPAKVLTVATSPGFDQQDRAIVYAKYLISQLSKGTAKS